MIEERTQGIIGIITDYVLRAGRVRMRDIAKEVESKGFAVSRIRLRRIIDLIPLAEEDVCHGNTVFFFSDWDGMERFGQEERMRFLAAAENGEKFVPRDYGQDGTEGDKIRS